MRKSFIAKLFLSTAILALLDSRRSAAAGAAFERPDRLQADGAIIDTGKTLGHASPWLVDINNDGKRDLIVGDFSGMFRLFLNVGSEKEPTYKAQGHLRADGSDAKVPMG